MLNILFKNIENKNCRKWKPQSNFQKSKELTNIFKSHWWIFTSIFGNMTHLLALWILEMYCTKCRLCVCLIIVQVCSIPLLLNAINRLISSMMNYFMLSYVIVMLSYCLNFEKKTLPKCLYKSECCMYEIITIWIKISYFKYQF
jgi:hypothetical protein